MSKLRFHITTSLDGFVAGPNQSLDNPLGEGGLDLHAWVFPLEAWRRSEGQDGGEVNASNAVVEESVTNVGAYIMGRNMFGGGPGPWPDDPWNGWWGADPPYHTPVFVLTNHARAPLSMEGGTTFNFVTDGIESALAQAKAAAGDRDVMLAGGASVAQQYLAAGLIDEMELHIVPVLLHEGARLLEQLGDGPALQQVRSIEAPGVTHIKYRVVK
ncbi:MAG: deaminase [Candidatus Nephthysia bennettiae]|uniref:Dihydrofolate reductase family protein n=1 Tax=Candidatus Nephthysia bennettiae TaxID=3127016 RepID=A0A934KE65_9BACT|nr:dihydrofolate reductase family protein [Candidatus Dormibacteraeota bacterium]PZR99167.1 MAG: deaminase [Candidatus Dormibacteraeota bacterium]